MEHVAENGPYCTYCGMAICWGVDGAQAATVDHVLARGLGGSGMHDNRVIACARCNSLKAEFESQLAQDYGWFFAEWGEPQA